MEYAVKKEIETRLMQLKTARRVSRNQIVMRCKFCGDSKRDPNKKRLYFKIDPYDDGPILYHCFNCHESGVLTPSVLRTLGVNDLQVNSDLIKFNNKTASKSKQAKRAVTLSYKVPVFKDTKLNRIKKRYIESRLGISLSYEDLVRFKIVLSLEEFLDYNKIDRITTSPMRANLLNTDYVGFLSSKNEMISYRDITDNNRLRYDKYIIEPDEVEHKKFYTIPTSIDVMTTETINLNIAEGAFDILGVYFNVNEQNNHNQVYIACNDSGYMSVIKTFIELGFVGSNIRLNIYSDKDKEPYFYKRVINEVSPWVGKVNLYYNRRSKDFGVPKDKIEIKIKT